MARRLSTPRALLVLAVALVAGGGSGIAARAVSGDPGAPPSGGSPSVRGTATPRSPSPSSTATPSGSPSPTTTRAPLSADNAVTVADLDPVGWDVSVYTSVRGQGGTEYPCQRTQLSKQGASVQSLHTVTWAQQDTYSGSETMVSTTSEDEARFLYRVVASQIDNCVKNPDLAQGDFSSRPVDTEQRPDGAVARAWRVTRDSGAGYLLVARHGDRLAVLALSDNPVAADPAGLGAVARSLIDRLG